VTKWTSLSPPRPVVRIATASTMVRYAPTRAPSGSIAGRPSRSSAISVVVPPISETSASRAPVIQRAPTMLAAGPLRMVSMGRSSANSAEISAPSPRTTISGAVTPNSRRRLRARVISRSISPIRRAFSTAVSDRFGPLSRALR
jgi:hypothetical protein